MHNIVREIALDGSSWQTKEDFYAALLPALGAPSWHGKNLDALNDSLKGGDINTVNPPFVLSVLGLETMAQEPRRVVDRFVELVRDLKADGVDIDIVFG